MREGWREYTLGAATVLITDGSHYSPPTTEVGIPYVTVRDIKDGQIDLDNASRISPTSFDDLEKNGCRPLYKDVLFSKDGTVGKVAFVSTHEAFVVLSSLAILRANEDLLLPKFLAITLSAPDFQREASSSKTGLAIKRVVLKVLKTMAIRVPPLPEQKRIVDLVSSVDSYIEALRQQLESAKISRNAVLHELLTVGGDGWVKTPLVEAVEVLDRFRKPVNSTEREKRKGNVPYYGANGQTGWIDDFLFNEELVLLGEDAIDFLDPNARKAYLISGPSWVNNHAHILRVLPERAVSYLLAEALNRVDYSQYVSFGTRSKLTQSSMNGIKILLPPLPEQKRIVDLISTVDSFIDALEGQISSSTSLRSGLLSDLLSGDHEIPASYDQLIGAA